MARPRIALPPADELRARIDAQGRLSVRVTPGARTEALVLEAGVLSARVRAKPEGGKANAAVRELLAGVLGIAPSGLVLERGETSRQKVFRVLS